MREQICKHVRSSPHQSDQRWPSAAWWDWRVYPAPDEGKGPEAPNWRRTGRWCWALTHVPACSLGSSPPQHVKGTWLLPPGHDKGWRNAPSGYPDRTSPKQTVFSNMTGEAEMISTCSVRIIYLCVYRGHCHDLEVKKSFMTFHPLKWRNLKRKFLKNNGNENFCLLEIVLQNFGDAERQRLFNAACLPQVCAVNSWEGVAPRQLASRIGPSAVDHCSVLAATKSKVKTESACVSVKW